MNKEKVFCEECRDDVNVIISEEEISATIKGRIYNYYGKIAKCVNCNSYVYVSEINDYNLEKLYEKIKS